MQTFVYQDVIKMYFKIAFKSSAHFPHNLLRADPEGPKHIYIVWSDLWRMRIDFWWAPQQQPEVAVIHDCHFAPRWRTNVLTYSLPCDHVYNQEILVNSAVGREFSAFCKPHTSRYLWCVCFEVAGCRLACARCRGQIAWTTPASCFYPELKALSCSTQGTI